MPDRSLTRSTLPVRRGAGATKVILILAGLAVVVGGSAGVYALVSSSGKSSSGSPQSADIAKAVRTDFDITTTASGELQAKKQIEIRSELEAEAAIVTIVAEGTFAKKDDVLINLNSDDIKTKLEEENSRVESAKADLIAAKNSYDIQESENDSKLKQAELKVELARLALDQWQMGDVVQKRKDIELGLDNTGKELARLEDKYKNSQDLYERKFLSKNDLDVDEIALRKARAEREKAILDQQTYESYQHPKDEKSKNSDVEQAAAELERVKKQNEIQLASKDADRINKANQLKIREDKVAKLNSQLEKTTIKAPADGLVVYSTSTQPEWMFDSRGPLQVGRKVFPNELLIVLPDTSEMIAQVKVHESLAGRIQPGQTASLKIDAIGGRTLQGTVDSIGILAEQSGWRDPNRREYTVKIAIKNDDPDTKLKPSMRCEAQVIMERVGEALAVPIQAVFNDGAVRFVYVPRSGGKFGRVPVQLGGRSDVFAEIVKGLDEGQRVLVREPTPSEVLSEKWDRAQLELVGVEVGEDGQPLAAGKGPQGAVVMTVPGGAGAAKGGKGRPGRGGGPGGKADGKMLVKTAPAGGDATKGDTTTTAEKAEPAKSEEAKPAAPAEGTPAPAADHAEGTAEAPPATADKSTDSTDAAPASTTPTPPAGG